MSVAISSKRGKLKKSKLEKIFELEADLKFERENNLHLQKELESERRKGDSLFPPVSFGEPDDYERKKLKDAFRTMRKVTINQEKSLHEARSEALASRKVCKQQESVIETLEKQLRLLENTHKALINSDDPSALKVQLGQQLQAFFLEQRKTADLQQQLNERDNAIVSLTSRLSASFDLVKKGSDHSLMITNRSEASHIGMGSTAAGCVARRGSATGIGLMRANDSRKENQRGSERSLAMISIDSRSGRTSRRGSLGSDESTSDGELSMNPQTGALNKQEKEGGIYNGDVSMSVQSGCMFRQESEKSMVIEPRILCFHKRVSEKSLLGTESLHSLQQYETDISVLKKEVNRKSIRIAELELRMAGMTEELDKLKARSSESEDKEENKEDDPFLGCEDLHNSTISFW